MTDFDCLAQLPGEEREQDWIRKRLGTLSVREGIVLAAATLENPPENTVDAINCLQSLDYYTVLPNAGSYEALGRQYLLNDTAMPMDALPFADLEAVGRQYEDKHPGLFIGNCYVRYPIAPPEAAYQPGMALPTDDGWSVKLKLASPAVPEGVWLRLPGPFEDGCEDTVEEMLAIQELGIRRWDECVLLDAQCILPEAGDLVAQYSDNVADLIYDSTELGYVLAQKDQGSPHFTQRYLAPLKKLKKLTPSGQEDFAALLGARVADIRVGDRGKTELVLEGVEAAELERLCDVLETQTQAGQAMGPVM